MKEVSFTFGNKSYRGYLAISTEEYPHYYWCFIDDPTWLKKWVTALPSSRIKEGS